VQQVGCVARRCGHDVLVMSVVQRTDWCADVVSSLRLPDIVEVADWWPFGQVVAAAGGGRLHLVTTCVACPDRHHRLGEFDMSYASDRSRVERFASLPLCETCVSSKYNRREVTALAALSYVLHGQFDKIVELCDPDRSDAPFLSLQYAELFSLLRHRLPDRLPECPVQGVSETLVVAAKLPSVWLESVEHVALLRAARWVSPAPVRFVAVDNASVVDGQLHVAAEQGVVSVPASRFTIVSVPAHVPVEELECLARTALSLSADKHPLSASLATAASIMF
jgi:hypothetical protein